jgi:magnesium transporter
MIGHVYARPRGGGAALRALSAADVQREQLDVHACDLVWVDISDPDADDIDWLERTFKFHQLALEDVARRQQRAKIDEYPGYYFCVVYATRTNVAERGVTAAELQFFWGQDYIVTIHSEPFPELDHIAARAHDSALSSVVGSGEQPPVVADVVYRLFDAIVDGYFPTVDAVAEWTEDVEERMFGESRTRTQDTLQEIFRLRKDLIQVRKTIAPSREVVNVLLRRDHVLFGPEFVPYFQDVYDHTVRAIDTLDTYRDLLASALDTHLSIVSNEVSQTVKKMTAVTAILMVNALIAGIYGMNFDFIPELHWTYGYLYALGLMLAVSLGMWIGLRRIQWL